MSHFVTQECLSINSNQLAEVIFKIENAENEEKVLEILDSYCQEPKNDQKYDKKFTFSENMDEIDYAFSRESVSEIKVF